MFQVFPALLRFNIQRRINHAITAAAIKPSTQPTTIPAIPPLETALCRGGFFGVGALGGNDGSEPNGQKSPPLGGRTHVKESPSRIASKPVWTDNDPVVLVSRMKAAGVGTVSVSLQLGPRAPIKEVLPNSVLP